MMNRNAIKSSSWKPIASNRYPTCPATLADTTDDDLIICSHPVVMEPKVGVGVFALNKEGKFVLGKRKGSHGAGQSWAQHATCSKPPSDAQC